MKKAVLYALWCLVTITTAFGQGNWPVKINDANGNITLFQPQVEKISQIVLEARCAVMVKTDDYPDGVFGAIWFECKIETDKNERTVLLEELDIKAFNFPDFDDNLAEGIVALLENKVEENEYLLSLDQLIASMVGDNMGNETSGLNNSPPEIIFTTEPSVLVMIDGEPKLKGIENTDYSYVQNTPFFLIQDNKTKVYYFYGGGNWYQSGNILKDWKNITNVPEALIELAKEALTNDEEGDIIPDSIISNLIVRTDPAELLQSEGEPEFGPLKGTNLLYLTNSNDDILMDISSQMYYVLISGRWYQSKSLTTNSWAFVEPDSIPQDFLQISDSSEVASVRSSVPGTIESKEAVLENQIPQTAEVDRSEASLDVVYDGDPKFESVEGTSMQYAVNTESSVLLIDKKYYCCENAVWFESDMPIGPWEVSASVPDQVQDIPASNPNHNVKYVYIYEATPEIVYVGYTPGYVHSYTYHGCVFYGTGYYYRPWYGVHYYPRHYTYGFRVHYNPYAGWGYSFGFRYGPPYGWMTFGYHSHHRGYWGPAGYRYGYSVGYRRGYHHGHKPHHYKRPSGGKPSNKPGSGKPSNKPSYGTRPGNSTGGSPASNNMYNKRKDGVRPTNPSNNGGNTRPSQPSQKPSTGNQPSTRPSQPSTGDKASQRPQQTPNNVYTDKSGNVYRREGDNWQKRENGSWNNVQKPSQGNSNKQTRPAQQPSQPSQRPNTGNQPTTRPSQPSQRPSTGNQPSTRPSQPSNPSGNLNRDYNSRNRGTQRTQQYNQNRSNYQYQQPSRSSSPSYNRGSGGSSGGSRSGGARRR